ncbi:MAG TPA: 16S rRNA (adenine(1518)-N(6)/adenine(1519)-N(6))-dimethyltransferase RsmA [Candidatus Saccharimonadales bacterium]|nr:16S rRNA (adenine(1518)-N(6)/adenine(1519)-N(6))-dimethyltransferase RsmA [Candidatus Saccharimonadales bacterium]
MAMNDPQHAPKKSLGQHWLEDKASLQAMCAAADLQSTDVVLEIGPGLGALTALLAEQVAAVVAVELDDRLAADLADRVPADNVQVVHQDILRYDLTRLPPDYKVVANIPYYLTSHLIRILSETPNQPARAVLLVQKEVAERIVANPGALTLLGVLAQFYWEVGLADEVPAQLFTPPPKVDSQIVVLTRRPEPLFPGIDSDLFFRLAKAGFAQRRKTLLNALSAGLHLSREQVEVLCGEARIDPERRAQTLSLEEWHLLCRAYHP